MESLRDLWPDDVRRSDALLRIGERVHSSRVERVTPAERRVLLAYSFGLDGPEVAEVLGVSPATVKEQAMQARRKLRAKNTTHAVAEAIRHRLIP